MGVLQFLKNRSGLRVDNRKTTSAATLTLRQSLWPLSLVTILFFLWVRCGHLVLCRYLANPVCHLGLCVRLAGHPEQTFPEHAAH